MRHSTTIKAYTIFAIGCNCHPKCDIQQHKMENFGKILSCNCHPKCGIQQPDIHELLKYNRIIEVLIY